MRCTYVPTYPKETAPYFVLKFHFAYGVNLHQMESLFNKLGNELLEISNQLSTRFEEGVFLLLHGHGSSVPGDGGDSSNYDSTAENMDQHQFEEMDDEEIEWFLQQQMMQHSPLEGIADSVIADIVSKQVSSRWRQRASILGILNAVISFRWDPPHHWNIFMRFALPSRGLNLSYYP